MHPGAAAACRAFATRLAVLRTGDALLGYGGLTQALLRNKEDGSQLVLVAVEADDSPDTLFDGLSDDSLMAAADAVLEGYGADLARSTNDASTAAHLAAFEGHVAVLDLVERFDIEPFPDFSAK